MKLDFRCERVSGDQKTPSVFRATLNHPERLGLPYDVGAPGVDEDETAPAPSGEGPDKAAALAAAEKAVYAAIGRSAPASKPAPKPAKD